MKQPYKAEDCNVNHRADESPVPGKPHSHIEGGEWNGMGIRVYGIERNREAEKPDEIRGVLCSVVPDAPGQIHKLAALLSRYGGVIKAGVGVCFRDQGVCTANLIFTVTRGKFEKIIQEVNMNQIESISPGERGNSQKVRCTVDIKGEDRVGFLADTSRVCAEWNINIINLNAQTIPLIPLSNGKDLCAVGINMVWETDVQDRHNIVEAIDQIRSLDGAEAMKIQAEEPRVVEV